LRGTSNLAHNISSIPIRLLLIFALITSVGCSNLSSFLFFPHQQYYKTPNDLNVEYETVTLESEGFKLVNWLIKPSKGQSPKGTILYLHGNGENISTHINSVAWLTKFGYEVFLLDYRGYGLSEGGSTLRSAFIDIQSAHRWISTRLAGSEQSFFVFGQSMGGALAITYAANINKTDEDLRTINALISESAPANWPQVAREAMRKHWLTWLVQVPASLIESDYNPEKHISELKQTAILLMHSKNDPVVDYRHFTQLEAIAKQNDLNITSYQTLGLHTQGLAYEKARKTVLNFLASNSGTNAQ